MRISVRDPLPLAPCGAPESPRAQPAASTKLKLHVLWAVFSDAITSWLTADAQINRWMNGAGTGPLTLTGFSSTSPGSCPGALDHPKTLSGSKSTWSFMT